MLSLSLTSPPLPEAETTRVADGSPAGAAPLLLAMLNGVHQGLLSFDCALSVLNSNDRFCRLLDIAPELLKHCAGVFELLEASALLDSALVQQIHEACLAAVSGGEPAALTLAPASGQRTITVQIGQIEGGHWMACFEDITARRRSETLALQQAQLDPLTGLGSRLLFQQRIMEALRLADGHAPSCVVLVVDLDRFKAVNDTLGHPIGDALLKLVAKRLVGVVRRDEVVARLGGDEFALLLSPAPERAALAALASRIVDVLSRPYLVDGHLVNIGASIGIAFGPVDGVDQSQLIKNADLALYSSKNSGRNLYSFFEPAMDARAFARRMLEIDLRKAILMREFELHYQPQVDLESAAVVGFEALLRWRHPERGLVPPGDFIPLAEEIGLIGSIGEWVLRRACLEAVRWPGDISVAVNVSPAQFGDSSHLLKVVARALAQSGLPGRRLEIEITESVLMRKEKDVLATLHGLRALGVRVAMDDFGTGYSSLSQLQSFPFDKIKIDRSFVKEGEDPAGQAAIVRAITALGTSLGMNTIAEGVETPLQLARIRAEGCTSVQGYLFSRPVPADQIDLLIADTAGRQAACFL